MKCQDFSRSFTVVIGIYLRTNCWHIVHYTCIMWSSYLVKFPTFEINCQPIKAKPELFLQYLCQLYTEFSHSFIVVIRK